MAAAKGLGLGAARPQAPCPQPQQAHKPAHAARRLGDSVGGRWRQSPSPAARRPRRSLAAASSVPASAVPLTAAPLDQMWSEEQLTAEV